MAKADGDLIEEARDRLNMCIDADDGDRGIALDDLKFRAGEQWDETSVRQRELDGRPCLTINNIPAIVHQVTNDVRQNRQAIHVHPVDDGADPEVAEIIEGLLRHVEYDSGADAAYDTALDMAASVGFGFFRLVTEYCDPLTFNLDMKIKRVRNPFTVYIDPAAQEADASDMRFAFVTSKMAKDEFERSHPNRDPTIDYIAKGTGDDANWLGEDYVRIAEYYRIEEKPETLVALSDGTARLASDRSPLPPGVVPTGKTRTTLTKRVMWYKLTAKEKLEEAEIPCPWIPIFPVYGDELDIDGKVQRSGLIRNAKDPARAYNYWITAATEEIALRTKTPFIGAMGQFEGVEEDWNAANNRSFSYLEYNPVTIDGAMAPAPQRQPPADVPAGYIAMAGMARDNVKAVTGIYDASLGNRSNETSGIAIKARQHQGDVGNFHFSDNLARAIRHLGRCMVAMVPKVYDTERVVRILGLDNQAKHVPINKPMVQPEVDEMTGAVKTVLNDLTVGTYDVVVTTGPAYNTLRQEAADSMVQMAGSWPKLMDVAGDKVVRAMDWPDAEDIAERLAKTLPPGLADPPEEGKQEPMVQTPKGPIPLEQAGQMIGQMDQTLEQMQGELEQHEAGLKKTQLECENRLAIAQLNATAKHDDSELKGMIDIVIAKMDANVARQSVVDSEKAVAEKPSEQAPQADATAMLATIVQALNPPRKKAMTITAPSGAVYQGEVTDAPHDGPQGPSEAPGEAEAPVEQGMAPQAPPPDGAMPQ